MANPTPNSVPTFSIIGITPEVESVIRLFDKEMPSGSMIILKALETSG